MESMEGKGIDLPRMVQTAVRVIATPRAFFRDMPRTGGFKEPLLFALVIGVAVAVLQFLLYLVGLPQPGMPGFAASVTMLILTPLFVVVGSFIGAAIMFVIWKLMGSREDYETSFRCCAYMMAIFPLFVVTNLIPYLGVILWMGASLYYTVAATAGAHGIPEKRAWIVFGVLYGVFTLLNIGGQMTARKMEGEAQRLRIQAEETAKAVQRSADEMRRQTERLQKQAEDMGKQAQDANRDAGKPGEGAPPTKEEMQRQMQDAQKALQDLQKQMERMKPGKAD